MKRLLVRLGVFLLWLVVVAVLATSLGWGLAVWGFGALAHAS